RHTRLQGDWSSDVCSSDLTPARVYKILRRASVLSASCFTWLFYPRRVANPPAACLTGARGSPGNLPHEKAGKRMPPSGLVQLARSEERRVGKECSARMSPE